MICQVVDPPMCMEIYAAGMHDAAVLHGMALEHSDSSEPQQTTHTRLQVWVRARQPAGRDGGLLPPAVHARQAAASPLRSRSRRHHPLWLHVLGQHILQTHEWSVRPLLHDMSRSQAAPRLACCAATHSALL